MEGEKKRKGEAGRQAGQGAGGRDRVAAVWAAMPGLWQWPCLCLGHALPSPTCLFSEGWLYMCAFSASCLKLLYVFSVGACACILPASRLPFFILHSLSVLYFSCLSLYIYLGISVYHTATFLTCAQPVALPPSLSLPSLLFSLLLCICKTSLLSLVAAVSVLVLCLIFSLLAFLLPYEFYLFCLYLYSLFILPCPSSLPLYLLD